MLCIVDYIPRYGCSLNSDGSRGENLNKLRIKYNTELTNKEKDRLNFEISRQISDDDVVYQISMVCHNNMKYWPSILCNETDILVNVNIVQPTINNGATDNILVEC